MKSSFGINTGKDQEASPLIFRVRVKKKEPEETINKRNDGEVGGKLKACFWKLVKKPEEEEAIKT